MADALEAGDRCEADRLADALVAEAEAASVPPRYREELLAAARSLAASVECPPASPPADGNEGDDDEDDDGNGKGKGKGKKGKGKKDKG